MNQRLLEGEIMEPDSSSAEIKRLRELNASLMRELSDAHDEIDNLKRRTSSAAELVGPLRDKLKPFYKLLQAIFGDIDAISPESASGAPGESPANNSRTETVWNDWKAKHPGAPAKIIDALQKHGSADTSQLCVLIGTGRRQTVHDAVHKLNQSGLITKNGGRFSLKQI